MRRSSYLHLTATEQAMNGLLGQEEIACALLGMSGFHEGAVFPAKEAIGLM